MKEKCVFGCMTKSFDLDKKQKYYEFDIFYQDENEELINETYRRYFPPTTIKDYFDDISMAMDDMTSVLDTIKEQPDKFVRIR